MEHNDEYYGNMPDVVKVKIEKYEKLAAEGRFIKVAVMGCAVNGPGEAREADFGVACGKGEGLLIAGGKQLKKVPEAEIIPQLLELIQGGQNG